MRLCGACQGGGMVEAYNEQDGFHMDVCSSCDGEGIEGQETFTVGRTQWRRSPEFEVEQKRIKFDKKNASRST